MIVRLGTQPRPVRGPGPRYMVHLQVRTAGATVRVGSSERALYDPGDGLQFTNADGVQSLWWSGDLWMVADSDASCIVEFA